MSSMSGGIVMLEGHVRMSLQEGYHMREDAFPVTHSVEIACNDNKLSPMMLRHTTSDHDGPSTSKSILLQSTGLGVTLIPSTINTNPTITPEMIRSATPFPLVSLFFLFIGFVLSNIGHIRPHRTILAFISGIFFILSGLSLVVGLVLYISSINDEMLNRTKTNEAYFSYQYGWSFAFAAISFLLTETAGVMSVYLFMKRYTAEEMYRPHPGLYGPRHSNCSDYSGQFLHPDTWDQHGRSPSSISSEASLQMNHSLHSNYPALLKCPEYDRMSSSPC
ncbi:voltage-dependent calcium channel gamma-5 subunit-like isoform X3 [Oncorhynchus keta]|uniref:voltage-dependent calcium channel gamma-5 subunit-like isoform X3 n=1 Tax=Oncorhynchus keta TaxID=8018 RepID=UPI00227AE9E0|nr:voltage-dependent calcium channel gamma-5 subunit-like isoform X3 [Oncorhynchus keta]